MTAEVSNSGNHHSKNGQDVAVATEELRDQPKTTTGKKRRRSRRTTKGVTAQVGALTLDGDDDDDDDHASPSQMRAASESEQKQKQQQQEPAGGGLGVESATVTSPIPHESPRGIIPWPPLCEATDGPQAFFSTSPSGRSLVGAAEQQQKQSAPEDAEQDDRQVAVASMLEAMAVHEEQAGLREWLEHFVGGVVEKRFCHSLRTTGFSALDECRRSLQVVQSLARVAARGMSKNGKKKTRRRVEELTSRGALMEKGMRVALCSVDVLPLGIFDVRAPTILAAAVLRAAAALGLHPTAGDDDDKIPVAEPIEKTTTAEDDDDKIPVAEPTTAEVNANEEDYDDGDQPEDYDDGDDYECGGDVW